MLMKSLLQSFTVLMYLSSIIGMSAQTVRLVRTSSFSGHIYSEAGKPMVANVAIYERNIVDGRRDLASMCSVMSDAEGRYKCDHLPAGDYLLSVLPAVPKGPTVVRVGSLVYGRSFYPSTTDPEAATLVTLSDGESYTADFSLRSRPAASLRGRLIGDFLKSSIRITQHGRNFDLPAPATINYDSVKGDVVVTNLAEGSYHVEADGAVGGVKQHLVATVYARAGTEQQIRFDPAAYHDVKGRLEIEGTCDQCLPVQMQLRRIDEESSWHVEVPVDATGTFTIRQVVDGDYVVEVAQPKSTCVEEIDLGGTPLKDQVLHLTSDSPNSSLQVRLVRTKASAAGLVDSSRVMSGKSGVVLQNVTTGAVDAEKVDGQGQFHYEGLEPGEYRVYAWRNLDLAEYRNRDYLMRYRKESNTFSISDTDTRITNLDPRMIE